MVHQVSAEYCAGESRRYLGRFDDRTNLVVLQCFGTVNVMTVLIIMEPALLELNVIRTSHNTATNATLTLIVHRTVIHVICDAAFVGMQASELFQNLLTVGSDLCPKTFRCPESSINSCIAASSSL